MTTQEALKKYNKLEIELLLSHVLGKPREFLYMAPERELSSYEVKSLSSLIKRREKGEPVAYILGYKDFCGLRFKVNKDVLIPRPESEWLVERTLGVILRSAADEGSLKPRKGDSSPRMHSSQNDAKKIKILDLGTGSGCIAISIAKGLGLRAKPASPAGRGVEIVAGDISPAALKVAKENTKIHKAKIKFIKSDLFQHINGKFDIIVANLPYVPIRMMKKYVLGRELEPINPFSSLKFEPQGALTDGTHSFQIYRRFFEQVGGHVSPTSSIYLEIDPSARKFITEYQKKYLPSWQIKFYKDFNHLWRYAEVARK